MAHSEQKPPVMRHVVPHSSKEAIVSPSVLCLLFSPPFPEWRPGMLSFGGSSWPLWICFPHLWPFGIPEAVAGGYLDAPACLFTSGDLGQKGL